MAKSLSQIQKQIATLQKEAEAVRRNELPGVIARIKVAIQHYGITAADLGYKGTPKPAKSKAATNSAVKYADGSGNTWTGRGPRPGWLKDALAKGKTLEEFMTSAANGAKHAKPSRAAKAKKPVAKYADGTGNTWSGRGPKPGWLKAALAQGKQLSELLAS